MSNDARRALDQFKNYFWRNTWIASSASNWRRLETSGITCQTAAVLTHLLTCRDLLWLRGRQYNIRNNPLYTQDEKDLIIQELELFRRFSVRMSCGALVISTAFNDVLKLRFSAFMFSCDADILSRTSHLIPR
ncbi:hypothetical protein EDD16DRAFT_1596783 [Pisolithus croceorrhizus]|nr:hypothetical protein EDD16DRAFT_1596783 [Pisolithus croceorrhizus]